MFLPGTREEMQARGWDELDVILVSGDAYIDSPFSGIAVIGRVLEAADFRVGVIGQPAIDTAADILRLGTPRLFWGVSAGCIDSMVANCTATGRKRHQDDFTPGGDNSRRPDRACIAYANLIRRACRPCPPIVLGGVEASLRRIAHYDCWSDRVRRSILFDAKADMLAYGMADRTAVELARCLRDGREWRDLRGICYAASRPPADAAVLPSFDAVAMRPADDPRHGEAFLEMFRLFSDNQDPVTARPLVQQHDARWLVHRPPATPPTPDELDRVHALPYERALHPHDAARGPVRALDTIRFSITTHRGCYGGCRFCAIAVHQGRQVVSRSPESILAEARHFTRHPAFRGTISDVGGPTANMYGIECARKAATGACPSRLCLHPDTCRHLPADHQPQIDLLRRLRALPGVKHAFVASGLRHDLVLADRQHGDAYLNELAAHHVSGQLKLAPEHSAPAVLALMGKPGMDKLLAFRARFEEASRRHGKKQFLTYYFIAAHPGCTEADMRELKRFATRHLKLAPEQVQVFTPTPSTWSTAMYWTERNPADGSPLFVEKGLKGKQAQKDALCERAFNAQRSTEKAGTARRVVGDHDTPALAIARFPKSRPRQANHAVPMMPKTKAVSRFVRGEIAQSSAPPNAAKATMTSRTR